MWIVQLLKQVLISKIKSLKNIGLALLHRLCDECLIPYSYKEFKWSHTIILALLNGI